MDQPPTRIVEVLVRNGFSLPDETYLIRLKSDPCFAEEALTTGWRVMRRKAELEEEHAVNQKIQEINDEKQSLLNDYRKATEKLEEQKARLEQELCEDRACHKRKLSEMEQQINDTSTASFQRGKTEMQNSLKHQISSLQHQINQLTEENGSLRSKIEQSMESGAKPWKERVNELKGEIDKLKKEKSDLIEEKEKDIRNFGEEKSGLHLRMATSLDALQREKEEAVKAVIKEKEEDIKRFTTEMTNLQTYLTEQKDAAVAAKEYTIQQLQMQMHEAIEKARKEATIEAVQQQLGAISQNITWMTSTLGKKGSSTAPNTEIGGAGENFIESLVRKSFRNASIQVTSRVANSADIVVELDGFKMLWEVKNKKSLNKEDLAKFEKDVNEWATNIHAAIFVNLEDTTLIEGHRGCYLDLTRLPVPALYIGGARETPALVEVATLIMLQMLKTGRFTRKTDQEAGAENERMEKVQDAVTHYLAYIHNESTRLRTDKLLLAQLGAQISSREQALSNLEPFRMQLTTIFPEIDKAAEVVAGILMPPTVGGRGNGSYNTSRRATPAIRSPSPPLQQPIPGRMMAPLQPPAPPAAYAAVPPAYPSADGVQPNWPTRQQGL